MGLSYSRAHHKVTKVAPVQTKEDGLPSPCTAAVCGFRSTLGDSCACSFAGLEERNPVFPRQLPPLRETRYGRCSTVPRPISFDIMMEKGETSIIKRHPPRRLQRRKSKKEHSSSDFPYASYNGGYRNWSGVNTPGLSMCPVLPLKVPERHLLAFLGGELGPQYYKQKLEPADLPQVITSEMLLSQQDGAAVRKTKELEKQVQTAKHSSGRRQHLHKLQMLEMNRRRDEMNHLQKQEEQERSLHREAKINKQKTGELKAKKVLGNLQQNNCSEGEDLVPIEHDQTFNRDHGNTWDGEFIVRHEDAESYPNKSSKVEMWFVKPQDPRDLFWDSSSTDSEEWKREERKLSRRPALVRTRTERIPLFDEFFD